MILNNSPMLSHEWASPVPVFEAVPNQAHEAKSPKRHESMCARDVLHGV